MYLILTAYIPSVMFDNPMPIGEPVFFEGEYMYKLYFCDINLITDEEYEKLLDEPAAEKPEKKKAKGLFLRFDNASSPQIEVLSPRRSLLKSPPATT